ncbi:MAG: hypothetical protein QF890_16090 [Myxococcota bacterium]|jgi:hypothetical protein|nr:hypothetical protein [Myxococcota bacterium]
MERVVHREGTKTAAATLTVRVRLYGDKWYAFGDASALGQLSEGSAEVWNTHNIFTAG